MLIQNNCKDMIKKSSNLRKTGSEGFLRGFFRKSFGEKTVFALSVIFMGVIATTQAWSWEAGERFENLNVPDDVQDEIQDLTKGYLTKIQEQVQDSPYSCELPVDEELPPQNVGEAFALIQSKISNAIAKSSFNYFYKPPPYIKDPEAFKRFQRCLFETMTPLADQAQEPLFLDNKQQFSVEVRPFVGHTPNSCGEQLGFVFSPRKQWSDRYISGQFLYANSSKRNSEVAGSLTYGQKIFRDFAGSMTVTGAYSWSEFLRKDDRRSYRSNPKVWSLGLSPMLVYYMPTKAALDLFLGGDVYYSSRLEVEESSDGETCTYAAENDAFYRVKFGPSYTMKREGRHRLYQLKFALAANLQSQIPDRFTASPSILFESQGHERRGGYLFKLGFDLGSKEKSWELAYGLRF